MEIPHFLYVGVTNGIGAGIMVNHQLYEGHKGFGGELGHTTIDFHGPRCPCGNIGCLELYASIPVVLAKVSSPSWGDFLRAAQSGDPQCLRRLDEMCDYLAVALVNAINTFDPEAIFIGHEIALAGNLVTERLRARIRNRTISASYKQVPILLSTFIDKAPLLGSATLVFDRLFKGDIQA
ncbi:MAG TPA: hypothetical protein DD727_04870 [Clostridiales bacterium]|nr:hypothetical protein [Clostridiales bacterium]